MNFLRTTFVFSYAKHSCCREILLRGLMSMSYKVYIIQSFYNTTTTIIHHDILLLYYYTTTIIILMGF